MALSVVTGASGHLGANLVRTLLRRGHQVRAVVREDRRAVDGLPVELAAADLRDPAALRAAFRGADHVFHLAAEISLVGDTGGRVAAVNVQGTRHVIDACRAEAVRRLVHVGTVDSLRTPAAGEPVDESCDLVGPGDDCPAYGRSKAEADRLVRQAGEAGLDTVIVYPTGVLGPHDHKRSRMGSLLLSLARGRFPVLVHAGFDWVDARDVADLCVTAAERAPRGSLYLASGEPRTLVELAAAVTASGGARPPRVVLPLRVARLGTPFTETWARLSRTSPLFTRETVWILEHARPVSHARASRELGYRPRPVPETVSDTVAWFREVGWLRPARAPGGARA